MKTSTLALLACPVTHGPLELQEAGIGSNGEVVSGRLVSARTGQAWPIRDGIPRFAPEQNYSGNFGLQWNRFAATQLDSHSGRPISRDRFRATTGWTAAEVAGRPVLDAGCGAGRFAEAALELGGQLIALDFSSAVDAARRNLGDRPGVDFVQADLRQPPFRPGTFPFIYSMGVLQHTPDPAASFRALAALLAPGGRVAVDVYPAGWQNLFFGKYWIRPFTKRQDPARLFAWLERNFGWLYGVSDTLVRVPGAGRFLRYVWPVANYRPNFDLPDRTLKEWALLDTFDMWSPTYDRPQSQATLRAWCTGAGLTDIEVTRLGIFVARARRPGGPAS